MIIVLIALALAAFIGFLLYIYFGPRGWLPAFLVGAIVVGAIAWLALNYFYQIPPNPDNFKDRAGAAFLASLMANSADPEQTRRNLAVGQRMFATLLFGVPAGFFTLKAIWKSSPLFGHVAKDMTETGLLAGSLAGMATAAWFLTGRS